VAASDLAVPGLEVDALSDTSTHVTLVHTQRDDKPEWRQHEDALTCWCGPEYQEGRYRAIPTPAQVPAAPCEGHVVVRWSDDGSAIHICDRCNRELVWMEG
jgi:hypothetical protein